MVRTGLDRVASGDPEAVALIRGRKIGLLAHAASVDRHLKHATTVLAGQGADLKALFGPEHGFAATAQDMIGVQGEAHGEQHIHSLYGDSFEDLSPKPEWLGGLDAVVIDLQDVGSRYYTYVWTAALMLKAASAQGVETIVLDRPNPLGGQRVEGAPQGPGYRSFVGLYDVPVRHGMTIGEMLQWVKLREGIDESALTVLTMKAWNRAMTWAQVQLPWVMPSPNMPTFTTALVYPGGCLIEGTELSEGRGSTRPFEIFGAPDLDVAPLVNTRIAGALVRPLSFQPTFHKHAGETCNGVQVHVTDPALFSAYETYLRLLAVALRQRPLASRWRGEPYEFVSDRPAIDLLTGGSEYRDAVDQGLALDDFVEKQHLGAELFLEQRRDALLY